MPIRVLLLNSALNWEASFDSSTAHSVPIGISFFTFTLLSYVMTCIAANGRRQPIPRSGLTSFFPSLIAARYALSSIGPQLCNARQSDVFADGVPSFAALAKSPHRQYGRPARRPDFLLSASELPPHIWFGFFATRCKFISISRLFGHGDRMAKCSASLSWKTSISPTWHSPADSGALAHRCQPGFRYYLSSAGRNRVSEARKLY